MARSTLKPAHVAQYLGRKSSNRIANARMRSTLCLGTHNIRRMYSLLQRLRSLRHGFWYGVSERIHWSRGAFEETPARELCSVDREQGERIAALRSRYQVQFELRLSAATSTRNYEYLDLLDRGWANLGRPRPKGGALCDVGCASFWYADALPNARFVVGDYAEFREPADIITAWFPFLTPASILAWRLPLSLLKPERLFRQIQHNLGPKGIFFMVNHGSAEMDLAAQWCDAAGLRLAGRWSELGPLNRHRLSPPVLSWWQQR